MSEAKTRGNLRIRFRGSCNGLISQSWSEGSHGCVCANLHQTLAKICRVNACREADGPVVLIVIKKELFGFAFFTQWAGKPILDCAGEHGAPKSLFRYFLCVDCLS